MRLILIAFLVVTSFTASRADEVRLPAKENFHLFLLVGQSNMAGRGKVTSDDKKPVPRVLMLNKQNQWVPAVDPIHFDKPKMVGVGLGRSFAQEVSKANPDITIGLIPCAVGGSAIKTWQPGGFHKQTKSHPYDDMLPRLRVAQKSGTLKAILWHQGESDSNASDAPVYETKLHALIKRLRDDCQSGALPFIAGQMGQFADRPWNEFRKQVDAVHQALPSKVPMTGFIPSNDLGHKGDKVHFDAASYREFGRRYAKFYLSLIADE